MKFPDYLVMKSLGSFEEILSKKIESQPHSSSFSNQNLSKETSTDPAHIAYLLGIVNKFNCPQKTIKYNPNGIRLVRKPHTLSEIQKEAFDFLKKYSKELKLNFTKKELKKAYRLAALKTHPDLGGSPQLFIVLKKHYSHLEKLF